MQGNRTVVALVAVIVLLVGAVAFLMGQRTGGDEGDPAPLSDAATAAPLDEGEEEGEDKGLPSSVAKQRALAVRIGRDGPHASACDRIGRVANLPGGADDFLAVREAPTTDAKQIDKLDDDTPLFVCDRQGDWYGIVYLGDGTLGAGDECGLANSVGAVRAYSGRCLTGWVYSRYVDASGAQDSDEPYVAEAPAPQTRTVQVSATGPTEVVTMQRMLVRAENDYDKPVSQPPDRPADCRETGSGDARWTCTGVFTLTN